MARTKNPQRNKPNTKVDNTQSRKEANKTKNSKISTANNKLPRKRQPKSSVRFKETIINEDGADSSTEETAFEEAGGLKLQDIANIVIGDLKQVRVTEATFNIAEENNQTCFNIAAEVSNNGYESQTEEQQVSRYDDDKDDDAIYHDDSDPQTVEPTDVERCLRVEDVASIVDVDAEKSVELNGGYDVESSVESEKSFSCGNQPNVCSTPDAAALANVPPFACSIENSLYALTNDAKSDTTDNIERTVDTKISQELNENCVNKCDTVTQQSNASMEEDEDFDLLIPDDKNESLNESYDDKDWVVCDESGDENLHILEEEVETFSLSKLEDEETESMNCDTKCRPVTSSPVDTNCDRKNNYTCDTVDIMPNEESVSKINNYFSSSMGDISKSKIEVAQHTNTKKLDTVVQSSTKFVEKSSVLSRKYSKESSKSRKNYEKSKKPDKKESTGRRRKRSISDGKTKDEHKERKSSNRRRRSDRLKSKPDYNEKYEGDQLLTQLKCDREKENMNREVKDEYREIEKSNKVDENASTFSGDTSNMPSFQQILENEYFTERSFSKDAERMICDCVLSKEEIIRGEMGCGEDCLNRLLLIECCSRCTLGDRCTNKRFQKREYAKCEAYKTAKKGYGLRVLEDIPSGTFIMEYVGEVINSDEFEERAMKYARGKIPHFYFMSLKSDCIIDATVKGNFSRFINHSCEPNAETQKWTVQGELRIGFFSKRDIKAGEEITFDYQLQRYGKQAQRCYCETPSCSGWIGEDPDKQTDDDKRKDRRRKKREDYLDWETALDEICQVGLINRHQTLSLNRLMVHAKELPVRMQILQLIEEGHQACRRLFVDYHGLPIIWSWMVDCTPDQDELKIQLLKTLMALPITNKTILVDSKVFSLVEQWAFAVDHKLQSEALSAQSVLESVEDIASAEETPVSEMAQKVLNLWSSLREAYRIPKKERIQQMKEHEREADQNIVKPRPRRLPVYAEKLRDRYHRNRYNKDFEKIYFDRLKDKRRKESPDRSHSRDHYRNKEGNKIARMEHRYMFEMKVAREDEERRQEAELMKRRWEGEEQNYWNYYYSQQHQMVSGQYMSSVPPTGYAANHSMMSPGMLQNMQSLASSRAHSHPYYASSSSYISPNIMLTHLPAATPSPHVPQSTPSIMLPSQVNASPQTYYQNSVPISSYSNSTPPLPVPYPHQAISELTNTNNTKRTEVESEGTFSYDYQALQSQHQQSTPLDEIPVPNEEQTTYSDAPAYEYKENNLISVTSGEEQDLMASLSSKELSTAIANAAAALDLSKIKLPPKWKAARDSEGRIYYYHTKTRISQWYPPKWEEPQPTEDVEQTDVDESSDEDSSAEEEDEILETRKRRRKYSGIGEILSKRSYREEKEPDQTFDMDAEIKENLAALSSEFQDSDNEDYSPVTKDIDDEQENLSDSELASRMNTPPPSTIPLITEHIISPREPIDKEERIRNKRRIRSLKEKLRRQKRQQKMMAMLNDSSSVADGSNGVNISSTINSSNSKLLSVPADTSSISDRQRKDAFRSTMANFVVNCLNPYFRSNCTTARITNYNDFKHLARKLTHFVMVKELKHCRNATELSCNSSVKHKAKEFIKKYMSRFGEVYVRPVDDGTY